MTSVVDENTPPPQTAMNDAPSHKQASSFSCVIAMTQRGTSGIGMDQQLPWKLSKDMAFFREHTQRVAVEGATNAVIMGRNTFESIPAKFRPLKNRLNIVLSRSASARAALEAENSGVLTASSLDDAMRVVAQYTACVIENVYVCGGASAYREAFASAACERLYVTNILQDCKCDTFVPQVDVNQWEIDQIGDVQTENGIAFQFNVYTRTETKQVNPEEQQYLDLVQDVITNGVQKGDRTGVGTLSKFGAQTRFSLRDGCFPLLTTKRVFWRGVVEELLWLIKGSTDAKVLSDKKVRIWDGNGSREFLDNLGFTGRREGDLGPVYGFQWRFSGAEYKTCDDVYTGQGIDQLAQVIDKIKNKPNDRRILMNAWNPTDLPHMALPPCHVLCQFYVADGELSCQMYQRSCDLGLGVPFNIASYSLLTCMLAKLCGLKPGEFVHCMGDTHVYLNHVEPLKEQLQRTPRAFPTLTIKRDVDNIEDWVYEDFELDGYKPMKTIKMDMAV